LYNHNDQESLINKSLCLEKKKKKKKNCPLLFKMEKFLNGIIDKAYGGLKHIYFFI
jgi:hypothetical protein